MAFRLARFRSLRTALGVRPGQGRFYGVSSSRGVSGFMYRMLTLSASWGRERPALGELVMQPLQLLAYPL